MRLPSFQKRTNCSRTLHFTPLQYPYRTTTRKRSISIKRFIIADDSSVLLSEQTIAESLKDTCLDIEKWCRRWIMAVNGSKTNILPLTNSHEDLTQVRLNGENCKISNTTMSLILSSTTNNTLKSQLPKLRETGIYSDIIAAPTGALLFRPYSIIPDLSYNPTFYICTNMGTKGYQISTTLPR